MNQTKSTPSFPRRLLRHVVRFVIVCAVLLGPNLVFYARWAYPDQILPPIHIGSDDRFEAPGLQAQLSEDLQAALRKSRENAGLPSMSAAIGYDGSLQWAGATGFADIENKQSATIRSRYRTGSVAKPLTAVALVRLIDAGKLELDAPISRYVPGLPEALQPLNASLLGSHRAGIRHYTPIPQWWMGWHENYSTHDYPNVADGLVLFINDRLRFAPGTGFRYSTFGYSLLARLMEGASGQTFAEVLDETVFRPAGMTDTAFDSAAAMPGRVAFYEANAGRYTPSYPINSSYKIAGGGMVTTPSDLVRLGTLLLAEEFVSTQAKKTLWTPLALADGSMNPENYAVGWRVDTSVRLLGEKHPTQMFHHGGMQQGAAAFFMVLPEYGISVAVMSNSGTTAARLEVQEAAYALARNVVELKKASLAAPKD